jgi:dTMP kinase
VTDDGEPGVGYALRVTERGKFVVLEGLDGAGTTTQTARLADALRARRVPVRATREPSDGPIGTMIRQVLAGRIILPTGRAPGWATMALLFAADRMDHVEAEIEPFLVSGGFVLSDRYDASSLAYQSVVSGRGGSDPVEWIRTLNRHALRPDLTIALDVSADVAAARREARGEPIQLYEQNEVQRALAVFYRGLAEHMRGDKVVLLRADGSVDDVHAQVLATYDEAFGAHDE